MRSVSIRPTKLRARAPRVPMGVEVESRTIGSFTSYHLYTQDVSRSGLLLVWDRESQMPFNVNTLIEMVIDPGGDCLEKPLTCLGKVVRRDPDAPDSKHRARLGVQIVQIDHGDLAAWEGCVSQLERKLGMGLSNKVGAVA